MIIKDLFLNRLDFLLGLDMVVKRDDSSCILHGRGNQFPIILLMSGSVVFDLINSNDWGKISNISIN